jgi:hypothetical protein
VCIFGETVISMYGSGAMDALSMDPIARDQNSNFPVEFSMHISFEV